jgi:hypothetical protein
MLQEYRGVGTAFIEEYEGVETKNIRRIQMRRDCIFWKNARTAY